MTVLGHGEIDTAVLGQINQRTLVGGTAIETAPIAEQVGISAEQLTASLARLVSRGAIIVEGTRASITPEGHVQSLP